MQQVSPESEAIFDFILELYRQCKGDFAGLFRSCKLSDEDLRYFQEYAAMFLGNLGNYKVGDY